MSKENYTENKLPTSFILSHWFRSIIILILVSCVILLSSIPSVTFIAQNSSDHLQSLDSTVLPNNETSYIVSYLVYRIEYNSTIVSDMITIGHVETYVRVSLSPLGWIVFFIQIIAILYLFYTFPFTKLANITSIIIEFIYISCPALMFLPLIINNRIAGFSETYPLYNLLTINGLILFDNEILGVSLNSVYQLKFFGFFLAFILVNFLLTLLFYIVLSFKKQSLLEFLGFFSKNKDVEWKQFIPFLIIFSIFSIASAFSFPIVALLLSWAFAGPRSTERYVDEESEKRQKQVDRLKGLIKIYGEVEIERATEIMEISREEFMTFLVENVGAGNLHLTLEGEKIITPAGSDIEEVLNSLDKAFNDWFEHEKTGKGKK
ncbi:MAG: hypothetical protein ACTSQF_09160 [Candidatus Heimdallarchaeaceae archaeon]